MRVACAARVCVCTGVFIHCSQGNAAAALSCNWESACAGVCVVACVWDPMAVAVAVASVVPALMRLMLLWHCTRVHKCKKHGYMFLSLRPTDGALFRAAQGR